MSRSVLLSLFVRVLRVNPLLFLLLATSTVANAAPRTIPCATDSQGNPMYFNTSTNDGSDPHPYLCTITTTVNGDASQDVRIDQPVVDRDHFEYKSIVFSPSDLVTVTADGCVQTAGAGATWKKYVNPMGSNSGPPNGLYFGSVYIKGAMLEPLPLNNLTFPGVNPPTQIFVPTIQTYPGSSNIDLTLNYADDNYNDDGGNGYYDHDNGNSDQCANTDPNAPLGFYGGPAWINLHIVHNATNPFGNTPPKDWDLVQNGLDANALANNPEWGWQVNGGVISNQGVYNAGCFPGCTSQFTSLDLPMFSGFDALTHWLADVCKSCSFFDPTCHVSTGVSGHHNWFDVTYSGKVFWVTHDGPTFGDDDYNMRLVTPTFHADPAGTTYNNLAAFNDGNEVNIGLEFDSDETIDHFDQSHFWNVFHQTVDNQGDAAAGNIINGHDAVVTGLLGIDEVHEGYTEIHPVHALAIRESKPGSPNLSNDYWAFFVRNWGDEGECSSQEHYLSDDQVTIQLTPPINLLAAKATLVGDTQVFGTRAGDTFSFYSGPEGTFVTFNLPTGSQNGFAFGELDLSWTGTPMKAQPHDSPQLTTSVTTAKAFEVHGPGEPEILLANIWNNTPAAQQQTYLNLLKLLNPPPPPIVSTALLSQIATSPPQRPANVPGVTQALATAKLRRDAAQAQAVCAATGGNMPTQPTWCPDASFPPLTTLTTSGGSPPVITISPASQTTIYKQIRLVATATNPNGNALLNGWYTTPVTGTLTAYDAGGSGIAFTQYGYDGQNWTTYTAPFVLPDGVYTFYYRSQDNKGNLEAPKTQSLKIDTMLTYAWTNDGPFAAIIHADSSTPDMQFEGGFRVYTFMLTVTNSAGLIGSATANVGYLGR